MEVGPRIVLLLRNLTVIAQSQTTHSKIGVDGEKLVEHPPSLFPWWHRWHDNRDISVVKMSADIREVFDYASLYLKSIDLNRVFATNVLSSDDDLRFQQQHSHVSDVVQKLGEALASLVVMNKETYDSKVPELAMLQSTYGKQIEDMKTILANLKTQKDKMTVQQPLTRRDSAPVPAAAAVDPPAADAAPKEPPVLTYSSVVAKTEASARVAGTGATGAVSRGSSGTRSSSSLTAAAMIASGVADIAATKRHGRKQRSDMSSSSSPSATGILNALDAI